MHAAEPALDDYETIAAAVAETERGRRFLAEHARRCQQANTAEVMAELRDLKQAIAVPRDDARVETMRRGLAELAEAIATSHSEAGRQDQGLRQSGRLLEATGELDAIVKATEAATSAILGAAEKVQEHAWSMRERGHMLSECDSLESSATEIFAACGFQDLTSQRTRKVIETLRLVEERLKVMLAAWDIAAPQPALQQPACGGGAPCPAGFWPADPARQSAIDAAFASPLPRERLTPPSTFGEMDVLSLQDRLRLFR